MNDPNILKILLYGEPIGTLTLLSGEQSLFVFNDEYINNPQRPTLSLSFKDQKGELITDIRATRVRLPPFFSNLLPEGHMRDYLANHVGVKSQREFFLLWALGKDLSGAITAESTAKQDWLQREEVKTNEASQPDIFRFSLAGVQLKFSAVMEASGGLTVPTEGVGGSWIVKLPSMRFSNVPENEYSMMSLAHKLGMDIPEVRLVSLQKIHHLPLDIGTLEGQALAVRRFDRTETGPVHMEDFAQIFGLYPDDKYGHASYKNIAEVLWAETGEKGIMEFVRRLVFNVLIGNADMHLKNWSLIYPDRCNAALAPGYDFVSTIAYIADEDMALNFVKSKHMSEFSLAQLAYFSKKAALPEHIVQSVAIETAQRFHEIWSTEQNHLPLSISAKKAINQHLLHIPLMKEI